MSQKPVDKRSQLEGRAAIWAAIRRTKIFVIPDLHGETRCSKAAIRDYLTGLLNGSYINIHAESAGIGIPIIYELITDTGREAPRVRKDGSVVTQGQGRENMWRTMRILKDGFTPHDLAIQASTVEHPVAESEARDYLNYLHKAAYLILSGARYRLLPSRYTGPKPPMIQRTKQVYDQNLKKVVWQGGGHDQN
ncbi:MAG: hypothetical protein JZU65_12915 [Chlorobium sp.]|nr:hypothetical protein [Chlorobium sp.]